MDGGECRVELQRLAVIADARPLVRHWLLLMLLLLLLLLLLLHRCCGHGLVCCRSD